LKSLTGKEFCRLLNKKGWELKRIRGSHFIFSKDGHSARISVPVHGNKTLKQGLQRHLMKIAGIDESEL
jgi:predicted RNA binding protein YcfA (HicA-like mRNA interferase family)